MGFLDFLDTVAAPFKSVANAVNDNVISPLKNTVSSVVGGAINIATPIVNKAANAAETVIGSAWNKLDRLTDAGVDATSNFWKNLSSPFGMVTIAIGALAVVMLLRK